MLSAFFGILTLVSWVVTIFALFRAARADVDLGAERRELAIARLEVARLQRGRQRAVDAWRFLDEALRAAGGVEDWWAFDADHERARGAMVRALGLDDVPPPAPAVGQVWSDPDGAGGVWDVSRRRGGGAEVWAMREIGGSRRAWWTAEAFRRARFVFAAPPRGGGPEIDPTTSQRTPRVRELSS